MYGPMPSSLLLYKFKCLNRGIGESSPAKEARCKLQSLNNRLFEELCSDVYDEVDRRENDAGNYGNKLSNR